MNTSTVPAEPEDSAESDAPRIQDLDRVLAAALNQIAQTRLPNVEMTLTEAVQSPDIHVWLDAANVIHTLAQGVADALIRDTRFPGAAVRMIRQGMGGASGFYPAFVPQHLIRRLAMLGSSDAAIAWLQKVLSTAEATGALILVLWGVPVDGPVELTEDVSVVPFEAIPESEIKQVLASRGHRDNGLIASAIDMSGPSSALMMKRIISPLTYDPDQGPQDDSSSTQAYEILNEVATVLTLIGPRVSLGLTTWFTFDDPDFEIWAGRSSQIAEIVPAQFKEYPVLDAAAAQELVQTYLRLPGDLRTHFRVAIDRINQAQRRRNAGDQAVELATALEMLVGDKANNEMTHKVKVRTVRMVGGNLEERRRNAAIVNKAYAIRSKMVHTGVVEAGATESILGERVAVSDIVDMALNLCVQLITALIRRGNIPDWGEFDITEQGDPNR